VRRAGGAERHRQGTPSPNGRGEAGRGRPPVDVHSTHALHTCGEEGPATGTSRAVHHRPRGPLPRFARPRLTCSTGTFPLPPRPRSPFRAAGASFRFPEHRSTDLSAEHHPSDSSACRPAWPSATAGPPAQSHPRKDPCEVERVAGRARP
jgi:hypothetical protein